MLTGGGIYGGICMGYKRDKIHIRDIKFECIIGINDDERINKQEVVVDVTLFVDLRKVCKSDKIEDTVDYHAIYENILDMGRESQFFMVERLAEEIAGLCLANEQVKKVKVLVEKPAALSCARTVGVEIKRYAKGED